MFVVLSSVSLFSQEKYQQHSVSKGETISEIAQQYNVSTRAILDLNPKANKGIKYHTVLLIPTKSKKNATVSTRNLPEKTHEVLPKETLYGIAKQHHITIEDLYKINPDLEKEGLKTGQNIKIPQTALEDFAVAKETERAIEVKKPNVSKNNIPKEEIVVAPKADEKTDIPTEGIEYEVLPKETLFSIAKKYGIKLADLQKANPELANKSIKVRQKIKVPVKAENTTLVSEKAPSTNKYQKEETKQTLVLQQPVVENKKLETEKTISVVSPITDDNKKATTEITHEVLPKESLYSIAKQYGITLSELKKANSEIGKKSLKVGQKINVPGKENANPILVAENVKVKPEKEVADVPQIKFEDQKPVIEMTHEVLPKETKFGIAKQYGLTVSELEKQNPKISKKLLVGSVLKISTTKLMETSVLVESIVVKTNEEVNNKEFSNRVYDSAFVDQLISKAYENIGTRYRSGGTTTAGFDCSGLMCYTFSSYDIKLPRSSAEMASYGSKIEAQNAQKGDLIFFKTRGSGRINHVGMVVEVLDGEIKFIHSATHGGVIISSTKESYYERNLAQINRVL